ncbi:MAG TPA: 5'/3'-nucleotidase SurE [Rhodospirillales bacterium]|nr:5'/3'-nucleotidase SurE [Rhodospirillales bacterium]
MRERVKSLKGARVLISNDDGIDAPGLKILERVMCKLAREVWVVAPETEQSAASHSLTLRQPLRIRKVSPHRYAVSGTPTDSVLLGINQIMKDSPPDLVLSGVNRGSNLGEDVIYSGTVAAAMEGTLLGFPAIALSQKCRDRHPVKWATTEKWLPKVLKGLTRMSFPNPVLVNVNFPDLAAAKVTGIEVTRQGRRKIGGSLTSGVDPRGDTYYWVGPQRVEDKFRKGTDLEAVNRGAISVSPLSTDLTHPGALKKLKEVF